MPTKLFYFLKVGEEGIRVGVRMATWWTLGGGGEGAPRTWRAAGSEWPERWRRRLTPTTPTAAAAPTPHAGFRCADSATATGRARRAPAARSSPSRRCPASGTPVDTVRHSVQTIVRRPNQIERLNFKETLINRVTNKYGQPCCQ